MTPPPDITHFSCKHIRGSLGGYSGILQWEATWGGYHQFQWQTYSWKVGGLQWEPTVRGYRREVSPTSVANVFVASWGAAVGPLQLRSYSSEAREATVGGYRRKVSSASVANVFGGGLGASVGGYSGRLPGESITHFRCKRIRGKLGGYSGRLQWEASGRRYHPFQLQTYSRQAGGLQLVHSSCCLIRRRLGGYNGRLPGGGITHFSCKHIRGGLQWGFTGRRYHPL